MTTDEFRAKLNKEYGIKHPWPEMLEVDHETYANVCQTIFNKYAEKAPVSLLGLGSIVTLAIGPKKGGIMFHGVELILKDNAKSS